MPLGLSLVLINNRKKISLTGRISYIRSKQDLHLCLKVNKTLWKCHVNCVGGMPEKSVTMRITWVFGKLYNH